MGRLFTSFDEAWQAFLDRDDEMEDFFAAFPDEDSLLLGWLLPVDASLVPGVRRLQEALAELAWITPQPEHFLHVWIGAADGDPAAELERARRAWKGIDAFDIRYGQVNCFHSAVVVEVEGDGPRRLAGGLRGELSAFLPHLTIGAVNTPGDPAPLRKLLSGLRPGRLGEQRVEQALLCRYPASRTTVLQPWQVVGAVALSETRASRGTPPGHRSASAGRSA